MLLDPALTMQAREYLGQEDPTQQSLQYVLESGAAVGKSAHGLPYLPTGNLVSGLPAALMSCCQASVLTGRLTVAGVFSVPWLLAGFQARDLGGLSKGSSNWQVLLQVHAANS